MESTGKIELDDGRVTLWHGDCIDIMAELTADSVDAVVTDPPYGLGFMGKEWDALPPGREWAEECLRVLKPGGHLLAFGGTRTWHRLAVAIEDAGFEIRDSIAWLYGSGFPKSLDVSKAIDKAAGATREVVGKGRPMSSLGVMHDDEWKSNPDYKITAPATPEAQQWQGWGTALKPAFEPIVVARKSLRGTVAANVLAHGTGALNIDGCRIEGETQKRVTPPKPRASTEDWRIKPGTGIPSENGRWPANVVLDEDQAAALDEQSGTSKSSSRPRKNAALNGTVYAAQTERVTGGHDDSGGASRFFYTAKAPKKERPTADGITHPTVKPLSLMRWLIRLVTPPGGVVLDPFAGSGTTLEAARLEGFDAAGVERETDYIKLIMDRFSGQGVLW